MNAPPSPSVTDMDKEFSRLRAEFAFQKTLFYRTRADDGQVVYFASRWGLIREFDSLDAAEAFLLQIGGRA